MGQKKKILCLIAVLLIVIKGFHILQVLGDNEDEVLNDTLESYGEQLDAYSKVIEYQDYIKEVDISKTVEREHTIQAGDYIGSEGMDIKKYTDYLGMKGVSILTEESGMIEYEVEISKDGFFNISFLYYPVEGKSAAIQRSIFIDGQLPYSELSIVEFPRIWVNEQSEFEADNQNNEIKPTQVEAPEWITSYCYDINGYVTEPLGVFLTKGKHIITIVSQRESMLIREIKLSAYKQAKSYDEVCTENNLLGRTDTFGQFVEIQAETANRKSSQMLYPTQDQSSPAVTPYNVKELRNNTIGGTNWRLVGQWLEWDFEIPESGYYYITLHAKQNFVKGIYTSRKITIDGEVPFSELNDYGFAYKQDWRMETLSDEQGVPFRIYLEAGKHTIRMENVLGNFSKIINDVENIVGDLNQIYRKVIRIIGVAPDKYRDYQIESNIPGLADELTLVRDQLDITIKELTAILEKSSDKERVLITMRDQLDLLIHDVENFSNVIRSYKINVSALGTWITQVKEQPLQLDAIYIYSPDMKPPTVSNSFFDKAIHELKSLYYSFVIDYNMIGNVSDKEDIKSLTVWVGTGRDQANVIKSLIDERFTKETGISVNVMLVDMNTLLQATLAGQGPDVALQVANDLPMNYGLRNAVADLSQFEDLEAISDRFRDSAMIPFQFEGKTYALPETQTFLMMFYRKDILEELKLDLPKTWDEVKAALFVLSKNQMELGMLPTDQVFNMFLYQNGGEFYNETATASALDNNIGINTFKEFTEYYSKYKLDRETSLEQRFRTGEAPIIIADYTVYNNLQVSAPDIKGLWEFTSVPGTLREDGFIDNTVASTGLANIMMEACKDKETAWEFMKWWSSAETQTAYGKEMEGLMGASARYPTANIEAFTKLPWPAADYQALQKQFVYAKGVPQVPGGYYTWRNVNNAFYRVVVSPTDKLQPREALTDYVRLINAEITYKRKEFGLATLDERE